MDCVTSAFKEIIDELSQFSDLQLESFQNVRPETRKKLKVTILDVLSSLGLLLELATAPTFSLHTLPIFMLRANNLLALLERDLEGLQSEADTLSSSMKPLRDGMLSVIKGMPLKAVKCFQ